MAVTKQHKNWKVNITSHSTPQNKRMRRIITDCTTKPRLWKQASIVKNGDVQALSRFQVCSHNAIGTRAALAAATTTALSSSPALCNRPGGSLFAIQPSPSRCDPAIAAVA
jgi:hypothetical protein